MGRRIAIVAKGGTSAFAPYRDSEWEVWGMPWISYPRVDLLFDIHEQGSLAPNFDDKWVPLALSAYPDTPIMSVPSRKHLYPNYRDFPMAEVLAAVPKPIYENTVCYQIGYAIMLGVDEVEEISLPGVHMMGDYEDERASVLYLCGIAEGMGIKVTTPPGSPLFISRWQAGRYGVDLARRDNISMQRRPDL